MHPVGNIPILLLAAAKEPALLDMPVRQVVALTCSIVMLVCWMYLVMKLFLKGSYGFGVVASFPPAGYVVGWVVKDDIGAPALMLIWSLALVLWVVVVVINISQAVA